MCNTFLLRVIWNFLSALRLFTPSGNCLLALNFHHTFLLIATASGDRSVATISWSVFKKLRHWLRITLRPHNQDVHGEISRVCAEFSTRSLNDFIWVCRFSDAAAAILFRGARSITSCGQYHLFLVLLPSRKVVPGEVRSQCTLSTPDRERHDGNGGYSSNRDDSNNRGDGSDDIDDDFSAQ